MHKIFLVSTLSLFLATNNAQAITVGDACTDNGLSANTRDGTRSITLICDGANWVETISLNTAGNNEVRIIGDGGSENPPLTIQSDSLSMIDIIGYGLEEFNTHGAAIRFHGAAGTAASPLATPTESTIGGMTFRPHDGTNFLSSSATIRAKTTENVTSSAKGTKLEFGTTETGTTANNIKMTIADNGYVGIGTEEPEFRLHVTAEANGSTNALDAYSDISSQRAGFLGRKARGTYASPQAIQSGDSILSLTGQGYDGSAFSAQGNIFYSATEDWSTTNKGLEINFRGTDTGTNVQETWMTLKDSNVGIGTAEPNAKLDVAGSTRIVAEGGANNPPLTVQSDSLVTFDISSYGSEENSTNYGSTIRLNSAGGTAASPIATQAGDLIGRISFRPHDGTDFLPGSAAIDVHAEENSSATGRGTSIYFRTVENGTTDNPNRMVIKHNGNIGIGTDNPTNPIEHANGAYLSAGGVWTNASSRDLKTNIQPIALETAVETVKALEPVSFYYKEETDDMKAGFIAEDVPDFVASADRKSLASMDIVSVLTKVVKNQMETIELLQKETTQLRNDLTQLQEKVNNQ